MTEEVLAIQAKEPVNALGLPNRLVNPRTVDKSVPEYWPVTLSEGYASIQGRPLWEVFPGESKGAFEKYTAYRQCTSESGQRSIFKLSKTLKCELADLINLRDTWHWEVRTRAYDLYQETEAQFKATKRKQEVADRHARVGKELFDIASQRLKETIEVMPPKMALELLKTAAELEKSSFAIAIPTPTLTQINVNNSYGAPKDGASMEKTIEQDKQRLNDLMQVMKECGIIQGGDYEDAEFKLE